MKHYTTYFFDLDGTLIKSNQILTGANELLSFLKKDGKKVYILTNHPVRSPKVLHNDLMKLGLQVSLEQASFVVSFSLFTFHGCLTPEDANSHYKKKLCLIVEAFCAII